MMATGRRQPLNIILGSATAGLFLVLLTVGVPYAVPYDAGQGMALTSPAFFPYILAGVGLFFSLLLILASVIGTETESDDEAVERFGFLTASFRFLIALATIIAYIVFLKPLGALTVAMAAMAILLFLGGVRDLKTYGVAAIIVPVCVYLIFEHVARVPLPTGIMPF